MRPKQAEYHLYRAQAREGLRNDEGELDDLNEAEELGSKASMLHYMRQRLYQRMGRDLSSRLDSDWLLQHTPTDEVGFLTRGAVRSGDKKYEESLSDFTQALKLNPNSVPGLLGQAYLLANLLKRDREALAPLDRLVEVYPSYARGRGARAVVRARLGMIDDALADLGKARAMDPDSAVVRYQAASVYGVLGRDREADKTEAFRLLCQALQKGYGWEQITKDDDLACLRDDPRFPVLTRTAWMLEWDGKEK